MWNCSSCGTENDDYTSKCYQCSARRGDVPTVSPPQAQAPQQVSPGEWNPLPPGPPGSYIGAVYPSQAGPPLPNVPAALRKPDKPDIMGLAVNAFCYSILMTLVVLGMSFVVGLLIVAVAGATAKSNLNAGLSLAFIMVLLWQVSVLFFGGYYASLKATERGWGWLYGLCCVFLFLFVWTPLINLVFSNAVMVKTYTLQGVISALLMELPIGIAGGWVVDWRYSKAGAAMGIDRKTLTIILGALGGILLVAVLAFALFGRDTSSGLTLPAPEGWVDFSDTKTYGVSLADQAKNSDAVLDAAYRLTHDEDSEYFLDSEIVAYHFENDNKNYMSFTVSENASDSQAAMEEAMENNRDVFSSMYSFYDSYDTQVVQFDSGVYAIHVTATNSGLEQNTDDYFLFKDGYVYYINADTASPETEGTRQHIEENAAFE